MTLETNVRTLTPEDRAQLSVLWHAAFPHGEYGASACALCRRLEAERVSAMFPDTTSYKAVAERTGRVTL